tara:strand:+ start:168402 stop:169211 length:810 start_codon:yes stop_codon:yes gene_type:complete
MNPGVVCGTLGFMYRALFVSDVHLDKSTDERWTSFLEFLIYARSQSDLTDLFLVGDIFDAWVSDHRFFIKKYQPFIEVLRDISDNGVQIHYFEGNHDMHLHEFWEAHMGCKVYVGPQEFEYEKLRVRVEHGDQVDEEDKGYLFLRSFLRAKPIKWILQNAPETFVVGLTQKASASSRAYTANYKTLKEERARKLMYEHGVQLLDMNNEAPAIDIVILGHVHIKYDEIVTAKSEQIRVVNLGTWLDGSTHVFELDSNKGARWLQWQTPNQ